MMLQDLDVSHNPDRFLWFEKVGYNVFFAHSIAPGRTGRYSAEVMVSHHRSRETWRPVVGYEGLYSVSSYGRVRSEERLVRAEGRTQSAHWRRYGERILKIDHPSQRYPVVVLSAQFKVRVHILVAEAFIGPCPNGQEVRHLDDDPKNNHLNNLAYGTHADNGRDQIENTSTCEQGHEFTPENTYIRPDTGHRQCRECKRYQTRKHYGSSTFQEHSPKPAGPLQCSGDGVSPPIP